MRKVLRVISLLMAVLMLTSVGWLGATAQETDSQVDEMIVQDNSRQEAAGQEVAERAAEEAAVQGTKDQAAEEAAEQETEEQNVKEATEQEIAEQTAQEVIEEADNQEGIEQTATESEEESKTDSSLDEAEEQIAAEIDKENIEQETNGSSEDTPFTAEVSIKLINAGEIRQGDTLELEASVTGANRSYVIAWQNRDLPSPTNEEPEWALIETGRKYQVLLTEETAEMEYRVQLTADTGEIAVSEEYQLPEPIQEEKLADEQKESVVVPDETDQPETGVPDSEKPDAEESKTEQRGEPVGATESQEPESPLEAEVDLASEQNGEDPDLERAEMIIVTEIVPMTEMNSEISEQNGEESENQDENNEDAELSDVDGVNSETAANNDRESEALDQKIEDPATSDEDNEAPEASDKSSEELEVKEADSEESQPSDENNESPEAPAENSEELEVKDTNGEELLSVDENSLSLETSDEINEEPVLPEENGSRKERNVRILSSLGPTVVCGETIHMALDLSDFEDCAKVDVIWEADKGSGWEEAGTGETFAYIATAESISWVIRARVSYTL